MHARRARPEECKRIGGVRALDHSNYTVESFCTRCVNPLDASVRVGRMQDLADQHAREREIVGYIFPAPVVFSAASIIATDLPMVETSSLAVGRWLLASVLGSQSQVAEDDKL